MEQEEKKKIHGYQEQGGIYVPVYNPRTVPLLPAGIYTVHRNDMTGEMYFESMKIKSDEILDIPSNEYETIVGEIESFLTPETKQRFKDNGYIYKRSTLLYGPPGTGKTCIVNRLAREVVKSGGIVFFNPEPNYLKDTYSIIDDTQPNATVMVIFEEFDSVVDDNESVLLSILDGEIQKENVIYIATTNYLGDIPPRIIRPGRFSTTVEIKYPDERSRNFYIKHKLKNHDASLVDEVTAKTNNLSIDEVKEVIQSHICFGYKVDDVVKRVLKTKDMNVDDHEGRYNKNSHQKITPNLLRRR